MREPLPQANRITIRWTAVFTGFLVDYTISALIVVFARPADTFFIAPNLSNPIDLFYLIILTASTGIGGYVAGRVARMHNLVHGLLVGVINILQSQIIIWSGGPVPSRTIVVASAIGCLVGALGGLISIHANQSA